MEHDAAAGCLVRSFLIPTILDHVINACDVIKNCVYLDLMSTISPRHRDHNKKSIPNNDETLNYYVSLFSKSVFIFFKTTTTLRYR